MTSTHVQWLRVLYTERRQREEAGQEEDPQAAAEMLHYCREAIAELEKLYPNCKGCHYQGADAADGLCGDCRRHKAALFPHTRNAEIPF